jgi:hypothetical protein
MITNQLFINPLVGKSTAFETARFIITLQGGNFINELAIHLSHGIVISRSDLFVMARVIDRCGEKAWFCRIAVGDLEELLRHVPYHLDKICFVRRTDPRLREYSLSKLIQKVNAKKGRK